MQETSRKLRVAQSNLLESEQSRERRLKMIKKTHSSALSLKQALIQDLQDMVAERDESIGELEARLQGCSCDHVKDRGIKNEVRLHYSLHVAHDCLLYVFKNARSNVQILYGGIWAFFKRGGVLIETSSVTKTKTVEYYWILLQGQYLEGEQIDQQ